MIFRSAGHTTCGSFRKDYEQLRLLINPHSPFQFWVNRPHCNTPELAEAYGDPFGSRMNHLQTFSCVVLAELVVDTADLYSSFSFSPQYVICAEVDHDLYCNTGKSKPYIDYAYSARRVPLITPNTVPIPPYPPYYHLTSLPSSQRLQNSLIFLFVKSYEIIIWEKVSKLKTSNNTVICYCTLCPKPFSLHELSTLSAR